jgi:hypothetical protein
MRTITNNMKHGIPRIFAAGVLPEKRCPRATHITKKGITSEPKPERKINTPHARFRKIAFCDGGTNMGELDTVFATLDRPVTAGDFDKGAPDT